MVSLLGGDLWSGNHVHDHMLVEELFQPFIQIFGHPLHVVRLARRIVVKEMYTEVAVTMDSIDTQLTSDGFIGLFALEVEGEKTLMKKEWLVFKVGVKEYDLTKFGAFLQVNRNIFQKEIVARFLEFS